MVQPDIMWKDIQGNLAKYSEMLSGRQFDPDLILFPEMFQTGFCSNPEDVAETMDGDTVRWMKRIAESLKSSVAASIIIKEDGNFFNRLVYIDPSGNHTWYDKRHLFALEGIEINYERGRHRLIVPLNDWSICFQICYDLRFPVWSRNRNDYDLLVNLANWPAKRDDVWNTLLKARALENQSYVAGVNRVGIDLNNIEYIGNTMVVDPKGTISAKIQDSSEGLLEATLSGDSLEKFRNEFPVWKDSDDFELRI